MKREEVIKILKSYISLLNKEGISVYKAFLFGSYATGDASDESDIDVMIVTDAYDETNDLVVGKAWSLTKRINTKIEPFFIGMKKFLEDKTSPLVDIVRNEGIEIGR